MIAIEPTTDEAYIKGVFLAPEIYAQMTDDSAPVMHDIDMGKVKAIPGFFLRVLVDGIPSGCFWLIWRERSVEAHTALLPNCRGRKAIEATRKAMRWVFDHTEAFAITSYAWSDSPAVRAFCRWVGMTESATAPYKNTRNGKPVNITYFETTREAFV